MTLNDILKKHGLTDEQITAVTADMKSNRIYTSGEENIDIRYGNLKTKFDSLTAQHSESEKLIEQLKAGTKDNEALQTKITGYESQITDLQSQLEQQKLESAIKVALLDAHVADLDYMTFKLKEKGEIELDDNGNIKGIEDKLSGLKTQFPAMFTAPSENKEIEVPKFNEHNGADGGMTRAELLRKPYAERAQFARENPEAYDTIMGK